MRAPPLGIDWLQSNRSLRLTRSVGHVHVALSACLIMKLEIVTNPYPVSASPLDEWRADDVPSIVVAGDWSPDVEGFVREKRVRGLYLNSARGWVGEDYGFLGGLEWLELVSILTDRKADLSSLSRLANLRRLSITSRGGERVDLSDLRELERCFLSWWTGQDRYLNVQA